MGVFIGSMGAGTREGQKVSDSMELEMQVVLNHLMSALGMNLGPLHEQ